MAEILELGRNAGTAIVLGICVFMALRVIEVLVRKKLYGDRRNSGNGDGLSSKERALLHNISNQLDRFEIKDLDFHERILDRLDDLVRVIDAQGRKVDDMNNRQERFLESLHRTH